MTIKFNKLISMIFIFITCLFCNGCDTRERFNPIESGDFIYTTWFCDDGYCKIIGLTSEGKEKDTLVFPSMIDGLKVLTIGAKDGMISSEQITITKAKNIYFPAGYIQPQSIKYDYNDNIDDINIYIGESYGVSWTSAYYGDAIENSQINFNIFVSDNYYTQYPTISDKNNINEKRGNICYYLDEETTYFVDYVNEGKVNVIPPAPYKDGYEFEGWYKDLDCLIPFDFDIDIVVSNLNSEEDHFNEIKIYAKWHIN